MKQDEIDELMKKQKLWDEIQRDTENLRKRVEVLESVVRYVSRDKKWYEYG
jgi:hypothetical protein